jgi:CRISPR system Cascade subunit CasE
MHLSRIIMDFTSPETRRLLLSPYRLHQAVFRAFPDISEGGPGRVLYRLDDDKSSNGEGPCLLVQSEKEPVWTKAELLSGCAISCASKQFNPVFLAGEVLIFRLRANPTTKKLINNRPARQGILRESEQFEWLKRKGAAGGFSILDCRIRPEGMVKDEKQQASKKLEINLFSVRFEGKLEIIDPELFLTAVESGIGSAKGFGFGLLSVAPVRG